MTAFTVGCMMELRAVCRPVELHDTTSVMADAEATHGESATSATGVDVWGEHRTTTFRGESAVVVIGVGVLGGVRSGGDRRQHARSCSWWWRPASARHVESAVVVTMKMGAAASTPATASRRHVTSSGGGVQGDIDDDVGLILL